jgi:hypothetical protein
MVKTHFRMPWYRSAMCGSFSEHHSQDPHRVTCIPCRRFNISYRAKQKGPPPAQDYEEKPKC